MRIIVLLFVASVSFAPAAQASLFTDSFVLASLMGQSETYIGGTVDVAFGFVVAIPAVVDSVDIAASYDPANWSPLSVTLLDSAFGDPLNSAQTITFIDTSTPGQIIFSIRSLLSETELAPLQPTGFTSIFATARIQALRNFPLQGAVFIDSATFTTANGTTFSAGSVLDGDGIRSVPEPAPAALLLAGLALVAVIRHRAASHTVAV